MFRALIWKEWRELWPLPLAAIPLSFMSFYVTKADGRLVMPVVWETSFGLWLILASVYVPTHLYSKERENRTANFLLAKPLDRFRLWWFRFFTGVLLLTLVALVLFCVSESLSHFYEKGTGYFGHRKATLQGSIETSLYFFSLSCLFSGFFRRQMAAIVGVVLAAISLPPLWLLLRQLMHSFFGIQRDFFLALGSGTMRTQVLCPLLLLVSLAVFARGDIWRRSKGHIALAYLCAVLLAALPVGLEISELPTRTRSTGKAPDYNIEIIHYVSGGGTRLIMEAGPDLMTVDLTGRQVHKVKRRMRDRISVAPEGDRFVYYESPFFRHFPPFFPRFPRLLTSSRPVLKDFEGKHRYPLFEGLRFRQWVPFVPGKWSLDGEYFGDVNNGNQATGQDVFVVICDSAGHIIRKHSFPVLEGPLLMPFGWDSESRFYYWKSVSRGNHRTTYWRIHPKEGARPEQVSFLPRISPSRVDISPDGKWFSYPEGKGRHRLCDISARRSLISEKASRPVWSKDGRYIAFLESDDDASETDTEEAQPLDLVVYEPATGERISLPLDWSKKKGISTRVISWSPSNRFLLLCKETNASKMGPGSRLIHLFAVETGQCTPMATSFQNWSLEYENRRLHWLDDDRLMWASRNRLIVTDADGSNPKEVFRVNKDGYSFNGGG